MSARQRASLRRLHLGQPATPVARHPQCADARVNGKQQQGCALYALDPYHPIVLCAKLPPPGRLDLVTSVSIFEIA